MRIALIGCGTVGRSFLRLLSQRKSDPHIQDRIDPKIVAVVDSGGAVIHGDGIDPYDLLFHKDSGRSVGSHSNFGKPRTTASEVIEQGDYDVVIETTPTNIKTGEPGLTYIRKALGRGCHVITTNKGPLALYMPVLLELAEKNHVQLKFSGTVGGGTPILNFAKKCLDNDRILAIKGILNGTTNFILSKMETGSDFDDALVEAQSLGIAEANPSLDVDGWDSASKLVILADWVLGNKATLKNVKVKGIRGISPSTFEKAKSDGCTIRLLARAEDDVLSVKPEKIPLGTTLCVSGVLNAVTFISEHAGEQTIIGKGAGGRETSTAILRDLMEIWSEDLRA